MGGIREAARRRQEGEVGSDYAAGGEVADMRAGDGEIAGRSAAEEETARGGDGDEGDLTQTIGPNAGRWVANWRRDTRASAQTKPVEGRTQYGASTQGSNGIPGKNR